MMVGLHQPGDTLLHRAPVGAKLLGLMVLSVTIVAVRDHRAAVGFLAVALALALLGRVDLRRTGRTLRGVLLVAAVAAALQCWLFGWARGIETLLDLIALALLALTLTVTTEVTAILDAVVRWLSPLRRVGIDPERVSLVIGLAIQALPGTLALAQETRDAARSRGLERSPRAYLTPFVVRVVARAHETGAALHARGIGDD